MNGKGGMIERQRDEGVEKSVRESEIGEEKINRDGVVNDEERVNGSQEKGEMQSNRLRKRGRL